MPGYCLSQHPKHNNHISLLSTTCGYKSYHNEKKSSLIEERINYILPRYLCDTVYTLKFNCIGEWARQQGLFKLRDTDVAYGDRGISLTQPLKVTLHITSYKYMA